MLKKMILIVSLCLLRWNFIFSQSKIVWTKSDSPIQVKTNIYLSEKDTLFIEPGTVIEFLAQGQVVVNGVIKIEGTAKDSIRIISYSEKANIIFRNNENHSQRIDYTIFNSPSRSSEESFLVFENAGNVEIENCLFRNGTAKLGGAIFLKDCHLSIKKSIFENNVANQKGGVIYSENGRIEIESSIFNRNRTEYFGGVISLDMKSFLQITSSIFTENRANYGGIISCEQSTVEIANITAVHNTATYGGLFYLNQADFTIINSILWNQMASTGYIAFAHDNSQLKSDYCCYDLHDKNFIKNKQDKMILFDINSIHKNPILFLGYDNTYSLQEKSPCINAGTLDLKSALITEKDVSGNPRISNGRIDIGAFEWSSPKKLENILIDYTLFYLNDDKFCTIRFALEEKQVLILQILSSNNLLINEFFLNESTTVEHEFIWDGTDFQGNRQSKGYYFYRILAKR